MSNISLANLTQYIPLALVVVISFMLLKKQQIAFPMLLLVLLLGVLLAGSPAGPFINQELSKYSRGYL